MAALLLVPACSDGSDEGAPATTTIPGRGEVPVGTWAVRFCTSFDAWLADLDAEMTRAEARLTPKDLGSGRAAVAELFRRSSRQTDAFLEDLEGSGAPDVAHGIGAARLLRERLAGVGAAMDEAGDAADELPQQDPGALQLALAALVNRYEASINEASRTLTDLDAAEVDPELREAIATACAS